MQSEIILLKTERLRSLWQDFCQRHTELYDLTCDEYMQLMASEIDDLEETIEKKRSLIEFINSLDKMREELISDLCSALDIDPQSRLVILLGELKNKGFEKPAKDVERLNLLLLDIVEKIQIQNKKNQIFLNKALHSLGELKASFSGQKSYKTYSSSGGINRSQNGY